jgi:hypothetical protein
VATSTTGLSAAGFSAAVNALGPGAEWSVSPSNSSGSSPSTDAIRFPAPAPTQVENDENATSTIPWGARAAGPREPEDAEKSAFGGRRRDADNALKRFDEQFERFSEWIDRFEKTAERIKKCLRINDAVLARQAGRIGGFDRSPPSPPNATRPPTAGAAANPSKSPPGSTLDVVA